MAPTIDRARSARNSYGSVRNSNVCNARKGRITMKANNSLTWVALMGFTLFNVITAAIVGCTGEAPGATYTPSAFSGEMDWPSVCESSGASKPDNCNNALSVTATYKAGENEQGLAQVSEETVKFSRVAGQLKATMPFSPPPVAAGQYAVAYLTYSGITPAENEKLETCKGASLPDHIDILPGAAAPDAGALLCIRLSENTSSNPDAGTGKGNLCVNVTDSKGDVNESDCTFSFDGQSVTPASVGGDAGCSGALLKDLPAKTGALKAVCVSESGSTTTSVTSDITSNVTVNVSASPDAGSGKGDACINIVNGSTTVDDTTCTIKLDGSVVTGSTPPANTCTSGRYIKDIVAKVYTVSASCTGNLNGQDVFEVVQDTLTTETVSVSSNIGPDGGSNTGSICASITDPNGSVDAHTCTYLVDGVSVTPDADAAHTCSGALLKDLTSKTSTISATCGQESGSIETGVPNGSTANIGISVVPPANSGSVCLSVKDSSQHALTGCTFDFIELPVDPTPSANPPASCKADGDYYFPILTEGSYGLVAHCNTLSGQRQLVVVAAQYEHVWMTLVSAVPSGELCVRKNGLPLGTNIAVADMSLWLGYGDGNSCVAATPAQLATMSVVDFSGPSCTDSADPGCAITISGLVATMKAPAFNGYAAGEERIFTVIVTDGADGGSHTVNVLIDTLNGVWH